MTKKIDTTRRRDGTPRRSGNAARASFFNSGREVETPGYRQKPPPVPDDTRDVTGRIFGDPMPGRSALDAMRRQGRQLPV